MYDLIIKNGEIIDGSGTSAYIADLGIQGGCIQRIAPCIRDGCSKSIDAGGYVVCPGFIDIDSHSDFSLFANPRAESKIRQGITTEIVGQGGHSLGPVNGKYLTDLKQYTYSYVQNKYESDYWNWNTQYEFMERLEKRKTSVNIASFVGYGSIRIAVMGFEQRRPENWEMKKMKGLLEDELVNGIHGLSLGLDNSPDCLATMEELVELAEVVKKYDGICSIHMRDEGNYLFRSIGEAIEISRRSGVKLQISHLKAAHPQNWGNVKEAIRMINRAKNAGLHVDYDVYPYVSYESVLLDVLPPWIRELSPEKIVQALKKEEIRAKVIAAMLDKKSHWGNPMVGSSWDRIRIASMKKQENKLFEGMDIQQISEHMNLQPQEVVLDLLIAEGGVIKITFSAMIETDLIEVMKQSMAMYSTDGCAVSPYGDYKDILVHPKYYGTYPRILSRYVRERKIMDLEDAIHKMTMLPAMKLNLKDRGCLAPGYKADITIFNKARIEDESTYAAPHQYPVGMKDVIVNGTVVIQDGEHTGALPGQLIKRK